MSNRVINNFNRRFLLDKNIENSGMLTLLLQAAKVAMPTDENDPRSFLLGCVGIRKDGVIVSAKNGAVQSSTTENYQKIPSSHAEGRCLRKLGYGGVVFVARVSKRDNNLAMARPCFFCRIKLRSKYVEKAYYTIDPNHYGVLYLKNEIDRIFEI
jgi:hypothetical protein